MIRYYRSGHAATGLPIQNAKLACRAERRRLGIERRSTVKAQERHRTARIQARIAPDALAVVRRAAEIQGRSVSDFVVAAAQEAAHRTIEEIQIIRLSVEDQRAFAEAILNPAPPTLAMERAIERHHTLIKASVD